MGRTKQKVLTIIASFFLLLQSWVPFITYAIPVYSQSTLEEVKSEIEFNSDKNEFKIKVNTKEEVEYILSYQTDAQTEAISGKSTKTDENFDKDFFAGTCSADDSCIKHNVIRGLLKTNVQSANYLNVKRFTIDAGQLNLVLDEKTDFLDITDDEKKWLTDGEDLSPPEATPTPTEVPTSTQEGEILDGLFTASPSPKIEPEDTTKTNEDETLTINIIDNIDTSSLLFSEDLLINDSSAALATDKEDYAPTDQVIITGSNLLTDTKYTLVISSNDNPAIKFDIDVTSDENGEFIYLYQLDGNYRPNYKVDLKDEAGVVVANITFTDSRTINSVNVNGSSSVTVQGSQSITVDVTVTNVGSAPNKWYSTSYIIGAASAICVNTSDHTSLGTFTETFSISAPSIEGNYNLVVYAHGTDNTCASGTGGTPVTLINGIIVDNTAPSDPVITSGPDDGSISNNNDINFEFTVDEDVALTGVVECKLTAVNDDFVSCDFNNAQTYMDLADGPYTFSIKAVDAVGNESGSVTRSFTIDTTSPSDPVITSGPIEGSISNNTSQDFEFTIEDTVPETIAKCLLSPVQSDFIDCDFNNAQSYIGLSDGPYTFSLKAVDAAGNESGIVTRSFTIDTQVPYLTSQTSFSGWYTSNRTSTFTYADDGSGIVSGTPVACTISAQGTNKTCSVTPNVCDAVGNCNTTPVTSNGADIDKTNPTNAWVNPINNVFISGTLNLQVNASDAHSGMNFVRFRYGPDINHLTTIVEDNASPFETDWNTTGLADGSYILRSRAEDNSGRNNIKDINVTIDNTVPSLSEITPVSTSTNNPTPSYTFNSDEAGTISYGGSCSSADTSAINGNNTITFDSLLDGTYSDCTITVTDTAGNPSVPLNVSTFTVDTQDPVSSFSSPEDGSFWNSLIEISGSSTDVPDTTVDYVTLFYSLTGEDDWFEIDTISNDGSEPFNWSYDWEPDAEGSYDIMAEATDTAGNTENSPVRNNVTYDITPPEIPIATNPGDDYTTDQLVTLASSDLGSGLDAIYYTTDDSDPSDVGNVNRTLYTGTEIPVNQDLTIKAIAYDNAGNASEILTATYGIAPKISDEAETSVSETSVTITWTTDDLATSRVIYDTVSHPDPVISSGESPLDKYEYANTTEEFDTGVDKTTTHSVELIGLTAGTTYYYRVISHGSPDKVSDESSFTTSASTTTSTGTVAGASTGGVSTPTCSDTKPGSAPSGLSAVGGLNSVTLTWNKANDPVSYYLVTYGLSSGSQAYGNPNVGDSSTTSYTVSNLSGGITYYFKVRAGNGCAPGDFSGEVSVTPSGGFVEGPATGFAPGVLGASTEEEKIKEEKNKQEVLGFANTLSQKAQNTAKIWLSLLFLLLILIYIKNNR